jgi:hypothetical protein
MAEALSVLVRRRRCQLIGQRPVTYPGCSRLLKEKTMPLPSGHERALEATIEDYRQWAELFSQPEFKSALDRLTDNPEALDSAMEDPRQYLTQHGLRLPDDVSVDLYRARRHWSLFFCRERGDEICCTGYSTRTGFWWRDCAPMTT